MTYATNSILQRCTAQCRIASPLGTLLLARSATGLAGAWFELQKHHPAAIDAPERDDDPLLDAAARQLDAYFAGEIDRLRRAARPPGHGVPARRLGRAAAHRTGRDVQLRRDRAPARRAVGEPRRRRRGRQQSGLDHRPVPPRRRQHRLADRLCRRPGAQDLAPAHRGRARGARRAAARASWSSIETARHRRADRARGLVGRLVPVHAGRRAGVRADRARLPARRRRRAVARAAARRARRARGAAPTLADDRRRRPDQLGVAVPLLRLRRARRSTPASRRSSTRRRRSSPRSSPGSGSATA